MSDFTLYLQLGLKHIVDLDAFDHIVFIMALAAKYKPFEWKKIIVLVTAFTIGHSATLALATLNLISVNSSIIEFLIPVTILLTCIYNIISNPEPKASRNPFHFNYVLALGFGLVHGMGFSNYLKTLLGNEESILIPLFSFNIGIEIGQIFILALFFVILFIGEQLLRIKHRDWNIFISGAAAGISLILMKNTVFW
ncbi:HupE/UreJ family protein [bacterium]|nr:MAG: HupE/UreJ family protein [bacterium]